MEAPSGARKRRLIRTVLAQPAVAQLGNLSPVHAAIFEVKMGPAGYIGLATTDPATRDYHLYSLVDPDYSTLKTVLKMLDPTQVIVSTATRPALVDMIKSLCKRAKVSTVPFVCFQFDAEASKLMCFRDRKKLDRLEGRKLSLDAFSALVKFTENVTSEVVTPGSLAITDHNNPAHLSCPLCEKNPEADNPSLATIKDLQEHFFHCHWAAHGYACHCCGAMYTTANDLLTNHTDCDEWTAWKEKMKEAAAGKDDGQLRMTFCRLLLCCSDCGWHTALRSDESKAKERAKMDNLKKFFSYHNNDGLLSTIVYFPARPSEKLKSVRFAASSSAGGDPLAPCEHCPDSERFAGPAEANEHYMKHHRDAALKCGECKAQTTTKYLLEQHQMSHVDVNAYVADFLSHSARIFPPPTNLSHAPRCGWKDRARTDNFAFGGPEGGIGPHSGLDLVDPLEDVREAKARLVKQRRRFDKGYYDVTFERESPEARAVRQELLQKYGDCEGISGLMKDPVVWLRDKDVARFREFIDYWDSEEGKEEGGPPKTIEVAPNMVRLPSVDVELRLTDDNDGLSGFLLNDTVFYCTICDTILKGEPAAVEHLKAPSACALTEDGGREENPHLNANMITLYSPERSPASASLLCPCCPMRRRLCSITGWRVHVLLVHGRYVACERRAGEVMRKLPPYHLNIRAAAQAKSRRNGLLRGPKGSTQQGRKEEYPMARNGQFVGAKKPFQPPPPSPLAASSRPLQPRPRTLWPDQASPGCDSRALSERRERPESPEHMSEKRLKVDEESKEKLPCVVEVSSEDDDNGIELLEDESTAPVARGKLLAKIRKEVVDTAPVGGLGLPGYIEDDHDEEMEAVGGEAASGKPVLREFAPDGDDDLCVVAEAENAGYASAAATIGAQREKAQSCSRCSFRCITRANLKAHTATEHAGDAGASTIAEELGIPVEVGLWICRACCLAWPLTTMHTRHALQHDMRRPPGCDHCAGFAFDKACLRAHSARVAARDVTYVCGECRLEFGNETNLHEHSRQVHSTLLFYFCKECEWGSTDGLKVYEHFLHECAEGCKAGARGPGDAWKCIGVCPAGQLHYQPLDIDRYQSAREDKPERFATPSLCGHRSFLAPMEQQAACDECRCLHSIHSYTAHREAEGKSAIVETSRACVSQPLTSLRRAYDERRLQQRSIHAIRRPSAQPSQHGQQVRVNNANHQLQPVRPAVVRLEPATSGRGLVYRTPVKTGGGEASGSRTPLQSSGASNSARSNQQHPQSGHGEGARASELPLQMLAAASSSIPNGQVMTRGSPGAVASRSTSSSAMTEMPVLSPVKLDSDDERGGRVEGGGEEVEEMMSSGSSSLCSTIAPSISLHDLVDPSDDQAGPSSSTALPRSISQ